MTFSYYSILYLPYLENIYYKMIDLYLYKDGIKIIFTSINNLANVDFPGAFYECGVLGFNRSDPSSFTADPTGGERTYGFK